MAEDERFTYREAGVDLDAAEALGGRIGELVESTRTEGVASGFGSFGGRFRLPAESELVATTDGVGTKLKVAFRTGRHDTVGEDLVNHCVDDLLTEGAEPLFFLDYFACGDLEPDATLGVVKGIARGCRRNGMALLGGETAEMPDFYAPGEYDIAGFAVGRVAFPEVSAREVRAGDRLVGLASSGLHTNGYTFARRIVFDRLGLDVDDPWPGAEASVGEVLLRVHRSYLRELRGPAEKGLVHGLAHVTGGGISGNLGRILTPDLDAEVDTGAWSPPGEFRFLAEASGATAEEMYRVFNMGVGMIAVIRPNEVEVVLRALEEAGATAFPCGRLTEGAGEVRLLGLDGFGTGTPADPPG